MMTWEGPGRRRVLRPPCSPLSLRTHFKEQVVREILEKERTIASVAASYDLVPQTVGVWVAKRRRKDAEAQDPEAAAESAEIARLRAENRELRAENEFLKKGAPRGREA